MKIFLDHELLSALKKIARRGGSSISKIIHAAVKEWFTGHQEPDMLNKRLEDMQVIKNHRQVIFARRGRKPPDIDTVQVIEKMRIERIDELMT